MLRISLIIAIIAGLAAAGLNFYKVRQVMVDTMAERDSERTQKETAQRERDDTKQKLTKTEGELKKTQDNLASTQENLKTTSGKLAASEKQVADLGNDLTKARSDRDAAQQELSAWTATGYLPHQIKPMVAELEKTKKERDIIAAESKVFAKKADALKRQLAALIGDDAPPELPAGTKGRVVAVDPKFDFVVIDIGGNSNLVERGEMLVNRGGKLVGKIRIASVQPDKSVANVIPEWKKDEIMEGDQVVY